MSGDLWTAWKPKTPESNKSMRCFHIAPGAAGKADETAGSHRDAQAPLVARAVEGT